MLLKYHSADLNVRSAVSRSLSWNWANPRRAIASILSSAVRSLRSRICGEHRRRRRPVPHLRVGGADLELGVLGVGACPAYWSPAAGTARWRAVPVLLALVGQAAVVERGLGVARVGELLEQLLVGGDGVVVALVGQRRPGPLEQLGRRRRSRVWTPSGPLTAWILMGSISISSTGAPRAGRRGRRSGRLAGAAGASRASSGRRPERLVSVEAPRRSRQGQPHLVPGTPILRPGSHRLPASTSGA